MIKNWEITEDKVFFYYVCPLLGTQGGVILTGLMFSDLTDEKLCGISKEFVAKGVPIEGPLVEVIGADIMPIEPIAPRHFRLLGLGDDDDIEEEIIKDLALADLSAERVLH